MAIPDALPIPSEAPETGAGSLIDPGTGMEMSVADLRNQFELLSQQVPRDPEAERAFIESKIEMIRNAPNLNDVEKDRTVEELLRGLK